jgi:4-amino-4-deoxy-L-arabinose transferase-like glycosyltransferase
MASAAVTETSAPEKAARSDLAWILVLAVAGRLLAAALYFRLNHIFPLADWAYENVSIALALLNGHGYSSPFSFPSGPTAFMPPGYPLLILGFMWILGTGIIATLGIIAFQIMLSVLTVVVVQKAARRFFGVRTGNFAGLLCALAVPMLFAPMYIWDTCLSALILLAAIAVAPVLTNRKDFAFAGLGCAIAALINPALLLTLLAVFGWSAWRARLIPWLGLCVFLIVFSPWPIRNYAVMHAFVPLRDNFGYELWVGNLQGHGGDTPALAPPSVDPTERSLFLTRGELGYMQQKNSLARTWIKAHPGDFAELSVRRFFRFWSGSSKAPAPMTVPLVAAALCGLVLLWRSRHLFSLFALPLVLYPLPYYITHADVRYQFVLDPVLVILAAYACESFFAWCARRPAPAATLASLR